MTDDAALLLEWDEAKKLVDQTRAQLKIYKSSLLVIEKKLLEQQQEQQQQQQQKTDIDIIDDTPKQKNNTVIVGTVGSTSVLLTKYKKMQSISKKYVYESTHEFFAANDIDVTKAQELVDHIWHGRSQLSMLRLTRKRKRETTQGQQTKRVQIEEPPQRPHTTTYSIFNEHEPLF